MNTSKSLEPYHLKTCQFKQGWVQGNTRLPCDCGLKQAIVEAVEGIYGDSDGLREFASTGSNQAATLSEIIERAYDTALRRNSGNMAAAARELGVTRQAVSIHYKRKHRGSDLATTDKEARNG